MSIKTRLILGISAVIILLFTLAGYLLIGEKRIELSQDIYTTGRTYAELSTPKIVELNNTYLSEQGFLIFSREMRDVFEKNQDINTISIYTFAGKILYDSDEEAERQYQGEERSTNDEALLRRIKSPYPSFLIEGSARVVYVKKNPSGGFVHMDENEKPILEITGQEHITNIVYPHENEFAVLYGVTYEHLNARIANTTARILYLVVFGILIGLAFGYTVAVHITRPIKKLTQSAQIIAKGDFKERVAVESRDEVGVLAQTFNDMARDLEKSMKAMIYKERVEKELEIASELQQQILPKVLPKMKGLDVAVGLAPAAKIGGDCYDFIDIGRNRTLFYIGDATGHGVPSGLVVAITNALIFSYSSEGSLTDIITATNRALKQKTGTNMFMTLALFSWNEKTLQYASAGHEPMLHYHSSQKKVVSGKGGGMALGMIADIRKNIEEEEVEVEKNDVIALYTDGVTEARSEKDEMYGLARLKRAMTEYGDLPTAEKIREAILKDVTKFMGKAEQMDDITLMILKRG